MVSVQEKKSVCAFLNMKKQWASVVLKSRFSVAAESFSHKAKPVLGSLPSHFVCVTQAPGRG